MYIKYGRGRNVFPATRTAARTLRSLKYDDGVICDACKNSSVKHTYNAVCQWCARIAAATYFNKAIKDKTQVPALGVEDLRATAQLFYITSVPCSRAGHIGQRDVAGKCYRCRTEPKPLSSRQAAKAAGETYYLPERPCKKCGIIALKRVDDGYCQGCNVSRVDGRRLAEGVLLKDWPNLEVTLEFAKVQGLSVYRTGDPCRRGHRGYRYTASGSCIPCLRGVY